MSVDAGRGGFIPLQPLFIAGGRIGRGRGSARGLSDLFFGNLVNCKSGIFVMGLLAALFLGVCWQSISMSLGP